jgi:hypothetical protein
VCRLWFVDRVRTRPVAKAGDRREASAPRRGNLQLHFGRLRRTVPARSDVKGCTAQDVKGCTTLVGLAAP